MKIMLAFLGVWMVVGLWAPPKRKLAGLIAGTAALLVFFFLVAPNHL